MKFSKYNMLVEMDYGLILYNSRQAKCVQIFEKPELEKFRNLLETEKLDPKDKMVKALYKRGYIVDKNLDEYEDIKKEIYEYYDKTSKSLQILLYVTENCNFDCVYCPQKHVNKRFSDENWEALYKYIEKSIEDKKYKYVHIAFFGGEPLLEYNSIVDFLEKMAKLNKKYPKIDMTYSMTTNGYLLAPKMYDKLVELGVKSYQITIDGFAETHDQMRPRKDGSKTWDKIIENLKYIDTKKDGASIIYRTNVSPNTLSTIEEFLKWSTETFKNEKFVFDFQPVSEFSENVNKDLVKAWKDADMVELESKIASTPRTMKKESTPLVKLGFTCKCARKSNYTISVQGKVSRCEQTYGDNHYFNGVLTPDGDIEFHEDMKLFDENYETKYCPECIAYPLCAGRACPVKKAVNPEERPDCVYMEKSKSSKTELEERIKKFLKDKFPTVNPDDMDEEKYKAQIKQAKLENMKKKAKKK